MHSARPLLLKPDKKWGKLDGIGTPLVSFW